MNDTPESDSAETPGRAAAFGLGYLTGACAASHRTFEELAQRPRGAWIGPMVVAAILTTLSVWIMLPEVLDMSYTSAVATMEKLGVPEADMQEALDKMPLESTPKVLAQQVLPNLVTTPIMMLIGAAFIHFVSRLFGSQSRFGPTLGMFSVAYFVWALGVLVHGAVAAAADTMDVTLGPGALFPGLELLSPLGIFLDLFDVFAIWHLIVLVAGITVVTRVSRGTAWGVGLAFWVVRSLFLSAGRVFMMWTQGG